MEQKQYASRSSISGTLKKGCSFIFSHGWYMQKSKQIQGFEFDLKEWNNAISVFKE
jgi:hypothetical protein